MSFLETHKQFILDPANATQNSVIEQENRIPERRRTNLVVIKIKIKQTPCNLATMKKTYRTEPENVHGELLNESPF